MSSIDNLSLYFAFEGYKPANEDAKSTDADVFYYGFVNRTGQWYIYEYDTSAGSSTAKTSKYVKGDSAYSTAWVNRESLSYDYFNEIFS